MFDPTATRLLGRTSVAVSRLGMGGGSTFMRADDRGQLLIDAALRTGICHFDTAPLYGAGDSEIRFGKALTSLPRHTFVISSKVGREGAALFDYSFQGIQKSVSRSCARLGLDAIDLVLIHDLDPDMQGPDFESCFTQVVNEAYPALLALREAGKIKAIGIGLKNWDVALRLAQTISLDAIMLAGGYTLLQQGALDQLLPWCLRNKVSVLLAAPFNTGILATGPVDNALYYYKPAPPEILERTRQIDTICRQYQVPLAAAALQFPLHHPAIASVVIGHSSEVELETNRGLMTCAIPAALWHELKTRQLLPWDAPVS